MIFEISMKIMISKIQEDLGSICDMLSLEHVESLQRIIIDKGRVTEDELFDVLSEPLES